MGTQKKHLKEAVIFSTQKLCLNRWIRKINIYNFMHKKFALNLNLCMTILETVHQTKAIFNLFGILIEVKHKCNELERNQVKNILTDSKWLYRV